jgi:hypothetical protein
MGSTPLIPIVGYVGRGIQILCQSSSWLSQAIVKWKGPESLELLASFTVDNSGIISFSMELTDQSPEMKSRMLIESEMKRGKYCVALWGKDYFRIVYYYLI